MGSTSGSVAEPLRVSTGFQFHSGSLRATQDLGRALGSILHPGDLVALQGNLGAGKTALTQGVAAGLSIREPVTSPTFILVAEYPLPGGGLLRHMDCYRMHPNLAGAEAEDLGWSEWLAAADSVLVVEWSERLGSLLPADRLDIRLETVSGRERMIRMKARGERAAAVLQLLAADRPG
ncbi:MAG: tRNA (adenosine(37)-N6)-threonylcarbamoyltransferase complex ATPase subunit type 1 TsaE [Caldilineaceae bacterium]|nr:tRNA (adenosine(37)-N6)-threonylcarbamoyltransferase complex ATPase subunit type 1 TsaE [Caldilineaceae bacterium]